MPARRTLSVPCPHARPEDTCRLPPGVRFCVCRGGEVRDAVGHIVVRDGQLFWIAKSDDGRELGVYTYVAMLPRAGGSETVELAGAVELRVLHDRDRRRAAYFVSGRDGRMYVIDASELVAAASQGKERVECSLHDGGLT